MTPAQLRRMIRDGRRLLDIIERYAEPQHTGHPWCECEAGGTCDVERRRKQQLTRAVNNLAWWSRSLSARHHGRPLYEPAMPTPNPYTAADERHDLAVADAYDPNPRGENI